VVQELDPIHAGLVEIEQNHAWVRIGGVAQESESLLAIGDVMQRVRRFQFARRAPDGHHIDAVILDKQEQLIGFYDFGSGLRICGSVK
jgi:hypothetical protein